MKVAVYSPYLSTGVVGGGEKHILEFARVVAQKHPVCIALSRDSTMDFSVRAQDLQKKLSTFLGWSADIFEFIETPLGTSSSWFEKLMWTARFKYLYAVTDGSIFFSLASKNNLHIQMPFTNDLHSVVNRAKLLNWQIKNANSKFTQEVVQKSWNTTIPFVQYPLIRSEEFPVTDHKENYVLSVGRFFKHLHSKRQDILIEIFRELHALPAFADWKMILCGPNDDPAYTNTLRALAHGLPIEFRHSVSRSELVSLYTKARVYWHATGFGQDERIHPESVEHFGISIVEAMAAGAIPVVVGKGGPKEILTGGLSKLLWEKKDECIEITKYVLRTEQQAVIRAACRKRAQDFSEAAFEKVVWQMM